MALHTSVLTPHGIRPSALRHKGSQSLLQYRLCTHTTLVPPPNTHTHTHTHRRRQMVSCHELFLWISSPPSPGDISWLLRALISRFVINLNITHAAVKAKLYISGHVFNHTISKILCLLSWVSSACCMKIFTISSICIVLSFLIN